MIKMRAKMITVGLLGAAAIVPIDFAKAAQVGDASWYSLPENITANGEQMDPKELTAAHRSLPFGTRVLVENLSNGQSVVVRINDRGPFIGGRIIDLSKAAAASIGMINAGTAKVRVTTEDGGILDPLGQQTASAKDGAADADSATSQAGVKEAKADGEDKTAVAPLTSAVKMANAEAKAATESVKEAKVASKPATKGVALASSVAKKHDAAQKAVRIASASKSPKTKNVATASMAKKHEAAQKAVRIASAAKFSKTRNVATASMTKKHEAAQKTVRVAASKPNRNVNARAHLASASRGSCAARQASTCSSRRIAIASNATRSIAKAGHTRDRRIG
jgi:peptidoglycan lytic transglycosylase